VADLSWVAAGLSVAIGVAGGEWIRQGRVARRLGPETAARWKGLSPTERYAIGRELRRGRALDAEQATLGAEAAAAMRVDSGGRGPAWIFGGLGGVFALLAIAALANGSAALAGVEAFLAAGAFAIVVSRARVRRRLAVAEEANRALIAGYER
jgi:hypothetical protein